MAINWNSIYSDLFSAPIPGNQVTPDTDNVDFDDFPGVNKAKMLGGDDFADGNDLANVIFGNGGCDYLRGDGGDDSLHGGGHDDAIIGDSYSLANPGGGAEAGDDLLWGGWGDDVIAGQNGNDNIDGGNGRDLLLGGRGNDYINGGMGADFVIGDNGNDTLLGGWNDDCLAGQLGNDSMRGGSGDDLMSGGDGQDTMYGGSQNDTMSGNAGHDYLNGGNGHDVMYGNSGDDVLRGWNGHDSIRGDCGDDAIAGDGGNDLLLGDKGQDYITGGAGDDLIDGGKHADIIEGNDNADCIKGGAGDDLIYGDNANPADPAEGEASDLISGGSGNDTIHGGEDDDQINGDEGRDLIFGDTGADTIAGDDGNDTIDGGSGHDHISGNDGNDSIDGGSGNDLIAGNDGDDTINGNNGHDYILGDSPMRERKEDLRDLDEEGPDSWNDVLNGNNGNDTIDGGRGRDVIDGGRGNDLLYGGDDGSAGDLIRGDAGQSGGGNDTLIGGEGNDTLDGGKGNDCLVSGTGDETLTGGADSDTFTFGYDFDANSDGDCDDDVDRTILAHGNDLITDFSTSNQDVIQLHSDLDITNVALNGNDMLITTSGGVITVKDAVLNISGLKPNDPDFNGSSDALKAFITDYNPDNGEGKGFVYFDDKCVTIPKRAPDAPETGWEARFPKEVTQVKYLDNKKIGDTTKNITEQIMAERFLNSDVNVTLSDDGTQILFDPDASTPPTVEVTASDEVIEDIDASAQMIMQDGIVSFDDIDSTDTVTITYEVKEAPVWSDGDFANVALDPQDLIDAFFTGVEDADKPGTTPWTWQGTFDLDFLAKDETIKFTIDVIATDCDDASSRVPLEFTITGTNDAPTIDAEESVVFTEAGDADAQLLAHVSTFDHDDLDYNDELTFLVESNNDIVWSDGDLDAQEAGLAARLENGEDLDGYNGGPVPTPGTVLWSYGLLGPVIEDLDFLGEGETITWSYTFSVTDPHGAMDSDIVDFTIEGTNDRPVAANLFYNLSEDDSSAAVDSGEGNVAPFEPLVGTAPTFNFEVTDDDVNDLHTFEIVGLDLVAGETNVYQTVDEFGNAYGKLTNNGDGTFTFDPEDDFQHLTAEESREVTFQYQARDDSGAGETPTPPSESELSALKTVTLTVNGEDDVDLVHTDDLLFVTENQSIWHSDDAFELSILPDFLGFEFSSSLDATIIDDIEVTAGAVGTFLDGVEAVGQLFADAGCAILSIFDACDDAPDLNIRDITIPGISTSGDLAAKVGLQPYFFFEAGAVDANIPVEVVFGAPRQVEHGDTFNVQSAFTMDDGATFVTDGPSAQLGLDFIFDVVADLAINAFGLPTLNLFDFDSADFLGIGELGEPGFNIFNIEPGSTTEIPLPAGSSLALTVPDFGANGTVASPTTLEGSDEEEIANLTIDVDGLISAVTPLPPLGGGDSINFGVDFGAAGNINVATFTYNWDLFQVAVEGILSGVQDFKLSIDDLALVVNLEDGSTITTDEFGGDLNVGDNFEVVLGPDSTFDVDLNGDADGLLDFDIEIDMEALFEHIATLELDINLILGFLRLQAGFTSDFATDIDFSLFDAASADIGIIPSLPFDPDPNDGFLIGGTIPLLEDEVLATLFNDEFELGGFNQETTTFDVDVA